MENKDVYTSKSKNWTYEKKGESKNDKMSKDINETYKTWLKQGYKKIKDINDVPLKTYIKYITKRGGTSENPLARNGGVLFQRSEKYVMLMNSFLKRGFPVQLDDVKDKNPIIGLYCKMKADEPKEDSKVDTDDIKNVSDEEEKELNEYLEAKPKSIYGRRLKGKSWIYTVIMSSGPMKEYTRTNLLKVNKDLVNKYDEKNKVENSIAPSPI